MNKNLKKFLFFFLITIILFISIFLFLNPNLNFSKNLKSYIPYNIKYFVKDMHFKYIEIFGIHFKEKNKKNIVSSNNKTFNYHKFKNSIIDYQGGRAYIDIKADKVFLTLGTGLILHTKIDNFFSKKNIKFKNINSNIKKIILYKKFYHDSTYGVKGLLIDEKNIYLSLSNEIKDECYNISIIKSPLNFDKLNFKTLYQTKECIRKANSYGAFQPIQSGGVMFNFNESELILALGEFRFRDKAQNDLSDFGKILKVNKNDGTSKILSKGHRNVQGLFFNKNENIILSTEHGPMGGDEININRDLSIIKNYGWPISSYGEHYPGTNMEINKKAPLYKSHLKYGFEEPIIYFIPSIGISQIIQVPDFINNGSAKDYFVASLGKKKVEENKNNKLTNLPRSLYHITFDKNYDKIVYMDRIFVGSRIRDLKYYKEKKVIFSYLEQDGSINLISK